jgi:hypothetical protein
VIRTRRVLAAGCTSYAHAYRYVLSTNGPVAFGADTRSALNALKGQIDDTASANLSVDDKDAALNALTAQLKA